MIDAILAKDLIYFSLALVSTFFGIMIITKCQSKLRVASLFLTFTLGLFVFYQGGSILGLYSNAEADLIINILHIFTISFILIALINLHQIISSLHNNSDKKQKRNRKK